MTKTKRKNTEKHPNNGMFNKQEDKDSTSNSSEDVGTNENMDLSSRMEASFTSIERDFDSEM